jgi:hypothetical protein
MLSGKQFKRRQSDNGSTHFYTLHFAFALVHACSSSGNISFYLFTMIINGEEGEKRGAFCRDLFL